MARNLKLVTINFQNEKDNHKNYIKLFSVINNVVDNIQNLPLYELSETDNNTEVDSSRINLRNELNKVQKESLSKYYSKINAKDKLMYIYTSGTTGLPKAAVITNSRQDIQSVNHFYSKKLTLNISDIFS